MNICDCGCDPNKPENCRLCWCVGCPYSFKAGALCHCCSNFKDKNENLENPNRPEKFASPKCDFCEGTGRTHPLHTLCSCVKKLNPQTFKK